MRTLTEHQINECNQAITIEADEPDPNNGNASHSYRMVVTQKNGLTHVTDINFQHGPIAEVGTNGITHEVLLAILTDRLRGFQSGPYACQENADALVAIEMAQERLHSRTRKRVARGVEGTHTI
jgi:hypothetical protein